MRIKTLQLLIATGLASGAATAHQAPVLAAHAHPHLGLEHLAVGVLAIAAGLWIRHRRQQRDNR